MSGDDININPGEVKSSGQRLSELAVRAKAQTNNYFDSQSNAAQGNSGFASGPALIRYATTLHEQMNGFIDELADNAEKIVTAAQSVQTADSDTAYGFNREGSALNGLAQPTAAGP